MAEMSFDRSALERLARRKPSKVRTALQIAAFVVVFVAMLFEPASERALLAVLAAMIFALVQIDREIISSVCPIARELLDLKSATEQPEEK